MLPPPARREAAMSKSDEDAVRRFLDASTAGDGMASLDLLTKDASYFLNGWLQPHVGKTAIKADFERQRALWSDFRYQLLNIASSDNVVFTERIDTVHMMGSDLVTHVVGVFEVTPDGLISSWRDYFDMKEVESQLASAD
jgi:limonene-1,2-epoxide hydrolase